jgi:hypothetical protein
VYIISSIEGRKKIRERMSNYPDLISRQDEILIDLSPDENPFEIDLPRLPKLLHDKYDIRIINHDGGREVLQQFCQAKIISQL